jgi:type IX secretion system PorP/SprF family membrane protein
MRFLKVILGLFVLLAGSVQVARAQQDMLFSQYMFNGLIYNPAFAGASGNFSATMFYRNQWTGFNGAPVSQSLIASMPIPDKKFSAGLTLLNDQAGALRYWTLGAAGAYKIEFEKTLLSIGLNLGMRQYFLNTAALETQSGSSPQLTGRCWCRFFVQGQRG